ncbi:MAG: hypothetical protein H6605_08730 [Flavobacteriales bacterium]|nr:hypothetical protein [Flavobacteriales bacterium]
MKSKAIILLVLLGLFGYNSQAQNVKGQTVFTLDYGFVNFTKVAIIAAWDLEEDATVKGAGPIVLGADYGLLDRLSVGVQFTTQGIKGTITDYNYVDAQNKIVFETFDYKLRRSQISVIPKFHYLVDNDKVDLYSGLRIGYLIWNKKFDSTDPDFPDSYAYSINDFTSRPTVGIVAFGSRFYFTENFGANVEINIGAPYVICGGVVYKIGGNN